jgi:molybdopterin synthase sulfur carrier subunit
MAQVTVRLFAALRELAGSGRVEAEGDTVADVILALSERFGERFASVASTGSVVVDGERADPSQPLAEGQEVALLPPVSGGRLSGAPPKAPRPGDERDPHRA